MSIVLIIPAYNEAPRIRRVLEIVAEAKLVNKIVVVDDGSTDGTVEVAAGFSVIRQLNNSGKWKAVQRAVDEITADIYITIDADLDGFIAEDVDGLIYPLIRDSGIAMTVARCNFNGTTSMDNMGHGSIHTVVQNISGQRGYRNIFIKEVFAIAEQIIRRHPEITFLYMLEHCANALAIKNAARIIEVPFGYNIKNPDKAIKWGKQRRDMFIKEMEVLDREVYGDL